MGINCGVAYVGRGRQRQGLGTRLEPEDLTVDDPSQGAPGPVGVLVHQSSILTWTAGFRGQATGAKPLPRTDGTTYEAKKKM